MSLMWRLTIDAASWLMHTEVDGDPYNVREIRRLSPTMVGRVVLTSLYKDYIRLEFSRGLSTQSTQSSRSTISGFHD